MAGFEHAAPRRSGARPLLPPAPLAQKKEAVGTPLPITLFALASLSELTPNPTRSKKLRIARRETTDSEPRFQPHHKTQSRLDRHVDVPENFMAGLGAGGSLKPQRAPMKARPQLMRRVSTGVAVQRNLSEVQRGVEM